MPKDELQILRARLNAHRELIVEILSQLMASDIRVGGGALGGPGDDLAVMDQEEDPGVLPTEAFAEQAEYAAEIRAIFHAARSRAIVDGRRPGRAGT
jgi:hypothetical protein